MTKQMTSCASCTIAASAIVAALLTAGLPALAATSDASMDRRDGG